MVKKHCKVVFPERLTASIARQLFPAVLNLLDNNQKGVAHWKLYVLYWFLLLVSEQISSNINRIIHSLIPWFCLLEISESSDYVLLTIKTWEGHGYLNQLRKDVGIHVLRITNYYEGAWHLNCRFPEVPHSSKTFEYYIFSASCYGIIKTIGNEFRLPRFWGILK